MKPLFFVGNVRSGTSLMVRLLNIHPQVFVSHESDICWILYQYFTFGMLRHPSFGGQKALKHTMKNHKKRIDVSKSVIENYTKIQTKLMRKGSPWLPPMKKKHLKYIGDKTPNNFIVSDDYTRFVRENFPDAVYVHMVRHPRDFVGSIQNRQEKYTYFGKDVLGWWVMAEKKVLDLKKTMPIITIRYQDIGSETKNTLNKLFETLDIPTMDNVRSQFVKRHPDVSLTDDAKRIVERYELC